MRTVTLTRSAGDTFALTVGTQTTTPLPFAAGSDAVKAALLGLGALIGRQDFACQVNRPAGLAGLNGKYRQASLSIFLFFERIENGLKVLCHLRLEI